MIKFDDKQLEVINNMRLISSLLEWCNRKMLKEHTHRFINVT